MFIRQRSIASNEVSSVSKRANQQKAINISTAKNSGITNARKLKSNSANKYGKCGAPEISTGSFGSLASNVSKINALIPQVSSADVELPDISHLDGPSIGVPSKNEPERTRTPKSPRGARGKDQSYPSAKGRSTEARRFLSMKEMWENFRFSAAGKKISLKANFRGKKKIEKATLVAADLRGKFASEMAGYCQSDEYRKAAAWMKEILFERKLIDLLKQGKITLDLGVLPALCNEIRILMANAEVKSVIDLRDTQSSDFIQSAAEAAFLTPEGDEDTQVTFYKGAVISSLPTEFTNNFRKSDYFFKGVDGCLKKIDDPKEFVSLIGTGNQCDLPAAVATLACPNIEKFAVAVVFQRKGSDGEVHSALHSSAGTAVTPQLNWRTSYVLSKNDEGNVIVEAEMVGKNAFNDMTFSAAVEMIDNGSIVNIPPVSVKISIRAEVRDSVEDTWTLGNPEVVIKSEVPANP